MNPFSAVVLYLAIWFVTAFVVLPIGLRTQDEDGRVEPGTSAGAPANFRLRRMFLVVTLAATLAWAAILGGILWSGIGVRDIDFFNRMGPRG